MKLFKTLAIAFALLWATSTAQAVNFPATLDTDSTLYHLVGGESYIFSFHNALKDAIKALEAKVGVDGSAVSASLDYRVTALEAATTTFADGSAATPGLRFGNPVTDLNTGFFHPGTGIIALSSAGAEKVRVEADGLAVLTTNAFFPIDVAGLVRIQGSNSLCFGGTGGADNDTCLARSAAHVAKLQGNLIAVDQATGDTSLELQGFPAKTGPFFSVKLLAADANPSFRIAADGVTLGWGAGGAGAIDTTLARSGANALLTSGTFSVTGILAANGGISIPDGSNVSLGTVTGSKIGTATSQKLGFFNATPVIQPLANAALVLSLQNLGLIASGAYSGAITTTGALSVGDATISGQTFFSTMGSLVMANGANSNVAIPTGTYFRVTGPTGAFNITGFANGNDGRMIVVRSTVSQTLTIINEATSTTTNRITTLTGADIVCTANENASFTLIYDGTATRWIVVSVINCATV